MNLDEMKLKEAETLELLRSIALPNSFEYLEKNLKAARFIADSLVTYKGAMLSEDEYLFNLHLERYSKGWTRVWTLMAKEHFKERDIMDVDMRYFRHLPPSYSFVMKGTSLGFDILVVPRQPEKPTDMKWISAAKLIKLHEIPAIMSVLKTFPDSWFGESTTSTSAMEQALAYDKKNTVAKLKRKRTDKHGFDWFE